MVLKDSTTDITAPIVLVLLLVLDFAVRYHWPRRGLKLPMEFHAWILGSLALVVWSFIPALPMPHNCSA